MDRAAAGLVSTMEYPVEITNPSGQKLYGILTEESGGAKNGAAIILLTPGIKSRVAPHRLYVKLAHRLAGMGHRVLRFDPHGMGDSEGEIPQQKAANFFLAIQTGLYVDDSIAAMDWFGEQYGVGKFILGGLCGGAITALLVAKSDSRVKGIISLGMPVLLERGVEDYVKIMSSRALEHHFSGYMKKLFSVEAWFRLITLKSSYRAIGRSVSNRVLPRRLKRKRATNVEGNDQCSGVNPYFIPALKRFVDDSGRLLLIFSGKDRLFWEFEERIQTPMQEYFEDNRQIDIHVVKNANHIFTLNEWQADVTATTVEWLEANFKL